MARHDEKTSADRAEMLSGGDTGDRLTEVDILSLYVCTGSNRQRALCFRFGCQSVSVCVCRPVVSAEPGGCVSVCVDQWSPLNPEGVCLCV